MRLPEPPFSEIPEVVRRKFFQLYGAQPVWRSTGGFSESHVFGCAAEDQNFCLRSWPKQTYTLERLEQVRRAVALTHAAGKTCLPKYFAADGVYFLEAGDSYWEFSEWLPGNADYHLNRSRKKLGAAMCCLAELHQVWNAESSQDFSPAWRRRMVGLEEATDQQFTERLLQESYRCTPEASGFGDLGIRTATLARQYAPTLQALMNSIPARTNQHFVLRDIWSDHVLFSGDEVSGVIDFGAAGIDEPATDVARLLGSMEPSDPDEWWYGLSEYRNHSPAICPQRVLILDQVSCLLSTIQWAKWLILERRRFEADHKTIQDRWSGFLTRFESFPWNELWREAGRMVDR